MTDGIPAPSGPSGRLLSSGDLARAAGLTPKALRVYVDQGLIVPAEVDEWSGYRRFDPDQVDRARLVVMLRGLDLPLARIASLLAGAPADQAAAVREHARRLAARAAGQATLAAYVVSILSEGERTMDIRTRHVPEATYLTIETEVTAPQIPATFGRACGVLYPLAERHGALRGTLVGWYGAQPTESEAAPLRIGVEIDPDKVPAEPTDGVRVHVEPEHEEAYARVTRAQVVFPQILQSYDEVSAHLREQNLTLVGDPREVYFADFATAAPDEGCCDVAMPFTR